MKHNLDQDLELLKNKILIMGGYVEQAVQDSVQSILTKNETLIQNVIIFESKINQIHVEVDQKCLHYLAKQAPLASDLRLCIAILKINSDLERMGDQAINIAYSCKNYLAANQDLPLLQIPQMAEHVIEMMKDSLDGFIQGDLEKVKHVLSLENAVDDEKDELVKAYTDHLKKNTHHAESAMNLIFIAKNLERIGDHATNIAEDVVFISTGSDIRHGYNKLG